MKKQLVVIGIIFIAVTIATRLLPHVPNMAPVAALALFSGVYLSKRWSIVVPVAAMLVSDIFVGFYQWQVMLAVYAGFILTVCIGWQMRKGVTPVTLLAASLSGSAVFFILSNAAVWAFTQMYSHTFAGLINAYVMALPFLKFSLVGDLAWTALFFVSFQLVLTHVPSFRRVIAPEAGSVLVVPATN